MANEPVLTSISHTEAPIGAEDVVLSGSNFNSGPLVGAYTTFDCFWRVPSNLVPVKYGVALPDMVPSTIPPTYSTKMGTENTKFSLEDKTFLETTAAIGFGEPAYNHGYCRFKFGYEVMPTTSETLFETWKSAVILSAVTYDPVSDSLTYIKDNVHTTLPNIGLTPGAWCQVAIRINYAPSEVVFEAIIDGVTHSYSQVASYFYENNNSQKVYIGRGSTGPLTDGYNYFTGHMRDWGQGITFDNKTGDYSATPKTTLQFKLVGDGWDDGVAYLESATLVTDTEVVITVPSMPIGDYIVRANERMLIHGEDIYYRSVEEFPFRVLEALPPVVPPTPEPPAIVPPRTTEEYFKSSQSSSLAVPLTVNFDKIEKILNKDILTKYDLVNETNQMERDLDLEEHLIGTVGSPLELSDGTNICTLQQFIKNKLETSLELQLGSDIVGSTSTLVTFEYVLGDNSLTVYNNGLRMYEGRDYIETDTLSINWLNLPAPTDSIEFYLIKAIV